MGKAHGNSGLPVTDDIRIVSRGNGQKPTRLVIQNDMDERRQLLGRLAAVQEISGPQPVQAF